MLLLQHFSWLLYLKRAFQEQVKLPLARDSDSNRAPPMKPWSSAHFVFLVAFQPSYTALGLLSFSRLMDIGACQPLPVRIPVKPTQVPLQVPAAATSNSMSGQPFGFRPISRVSPALQSPLTRDSIQTSPGRYSLSSGVTSRSHIIIPNLIQFVVHIPTFVRCRCTSSIVFGDAGSGEDSLLNFREPLCPLTMVRVFFCSVTQH
jgi:hypothetical protein